MTSRRVGARTRSLTLEAREHEAALRARTALNEQTKGDFPIFAERTPEAARHNPFARLGDGALRAVEVTGLLAILGVGFGYLVPNFTWPPDVGHMTALAAVLTSCAAAVLASQRLAENRQRLISAGLHWKIADSGVFVSDAASGEIAIRFIAWSNVSVAESHRGRVVLLDAKGDILADLNSPDEAQEMLQVIQSLRARRGEGNPGEVRGPRIEPRLDYPERLDASPNGPAFGFDGPVDLDALRHQTFGLDHRREPWIEPPRAPALEVRVAEVLDVEFVEVPSAPTDADTGAQDPADSAVAVVTETESGAPEAAKLEVAIVASTEADAETEVETSEQPAHATEAISTTDSSVAPAAAAENPVPDHPEAEIDAASRSDDRVPPIEPVKTGAEIDLDLARTIDEGIRGLFEPIAATVVPEAVRANHEASTRPVAIDTSRVLPHNDDPIAARDDTVMRRLMADLATTAEETGVDPHAYVVAGVQEHLHRAGGANLDSIQAKVA